MLLLLGILIMLGVHVGAVLAFLGAFGLFLASGDIEIGVRLLGTTAFSGIMSYTFAVVPFFVAMGLIASISGASARVYETANLLTRRVRGGLGIATVVANAVFAAITGVSVASAAVFSQVALPQMLSHGYDRKFALGIVAGSSVLGMLIPPSLYFIIYGILSDEAIGRLFIAGIIPGIILTTTYSVGITVMVWRLPHLITRRAGAKDDRRLSSYEVLRSISKCWGIVALICLTLGGIWVGLFTPTEAGAVGAFGALALGLINRQINASKFWRILLETGITSSSILFLLMAAQVFARMLALTGMVQWFSSFTLGLPVPPMVLILLFLLVMLVLGFFIDSTSILLLTLPLMLPIVRELGFDLIWFGVVCVVTVEMGIISPPFGLVVFAMKGALGDQVLVEDIFQGVLPFLCMMIPFVALLMLVPDLSTWLPRVLM